MSNKKIIGWSIKIFLEDGSEEMVDTSDLYDDVAQGIDDYLQEKFEQGE